MSKLNGGNIAGGNTKGRSEHDYYDTPKQGTNNFLDLVFKDKVIDTTLEFCELLGSKFMRAEVNTREKWMGYAEKHEWIK